MTGRSRSLALVRDEPGIGDTGGAANEKREFFHVEVAPNAVFVGEGLSVGSAEHLTGSTLWHAWPRPALPAWNFENPASGAKRESALESLTGHVVRALRQRPRNEITSRAESFFEQLRHELRTLPIENLPPLRGSELEDDGFAIEWILDADRRLMFTFERKEKDSGWHFVSSKSSGGIQACGEFSGLGLRALLVWAVTLKQ
jgi:hypothetical protein